MRNHSNWQCSSGETILLPLLHVSGITCILLALGLFYSCCFVCSARNVATAEMSCHAVQSEPAEIEIKFSSTTTLTDQEKEMLQRHRFFSCIFLTVFKNCDILDLKIRIWQDPYPNTLRYVKHYMLKWTINIILFCILPIFLTLTKNFIE